MIKEERKAREAKLISGLHGNFWQLLVAMADGISQMTSQPGAALGGTPQVLCYELIIPLRPPPENAPAIFSTLLITMATEHPAP